MKLLPFAFGGLFAAAVSATGLGLGGKKSKEFEKLFKKTAGEDNAVCAEELKKVLGLVTYNAYLNTVTLNTCRIIVSINDDDGTGKLELGEFRKVWNLLKKLVTILVTASLNMFV